MGGASRWRLENLDVYPSYLSLRMTILTLSLDFINQLKSSHGTKIQSQDYNRPTRQNNNIKIYHLHNVTLENVCIKL